MRKFYILLFVLFSLNLVATNNVDNFSQLKKNAPNVFIDCNICDMDYIKEKIVFVNYVDEVRKADVYILITILRTGSGGREYTISYEGQRNFRGINDKIVVYTKLDDTVEVRREKLVKNLKIGLVRYVRNNEILKYINIDFNKKIKTKNIKDKWNNWKFDVYFSAFISGEKMYKSNMFVFRTDASRVTEKSRFRTQYININRTSEYIIDDEELKSEKKSYFFKTIYVGAINDHFSFGGEFKIDSSTYYNRKKRYKFAPAIEYNIFPYSMATSKQLRIKYSIGLEDIQYYEITIYDKLKETLFFHELTIELESKQKWGELNLDLDFDQYFNDLKKYSLEFNAGISWRIYKGISFSVNGGYTVVHNQLFLPKGDLTPEEIFLRTSAMETNYDYWISVGIGISFGSIYSNVVNPRFGY